MQKILSISVAAYNVEKYIEKAILSLTDPRYVDYLEVFVIDDGGSDRTLEIAQTYQQKFPETFHTVHKENGGYGSTVNYSISHATGKYFKLLDGDDWLDSEGLYRIVKKLAECDEDVVITGRFIGCSETDFTIEETGQTDDSVVDAQTFAGEHVFGMWMIFYKTSIIRESGLIMPEHTLYSDQLYSVIPFTSCQTIRFLNTPVYFYRIGRDEQSTSIISRKKHFIEMIQICDTLYDFYENNDCSPYIKTRISRYYVVALKTLLLFASEPDGKKQFVEYEKRIRKEHRNIYDYAEKSVKFGKFLSFMRKTNYVFFNLLRIVPPNIWHH